VAAALVADAVQDEPAAARGELRVVEARLDVRSVRVYGAEVGGVPPLREVAAKDVGHVELIEEQDHPARDLAAGRF